VATFLPLTLGSAMKSEQDLLRMNQLLSLVMGGLLVIGIGGAGLVYGPGVMRSVHNFYHPKRVDPAVTLAPYVQTTPMDFSNVKPIFEPYQFKPSDFRQPDISPAINSQIMRDIDRANSYSRPPYHP
jgi:hypothetical protein